MKKLNTKQDSPHIVQFIFKDFLNRIEQLKKWTRAGEPPPSTQVKTLYLILFLFIFGITTLSMWILAYLKIMFVDVVTDFALFGSIVFISLCPALYGMWTSFCCWRKMPGYDWYIIPHF